MALIAASHCLSRREMLISANKVEQIVLGYFVPLLILFGVAGNFINLTVLTANKMKSRPVFCFLDKKCF